MMPPKPSPFPMARHPKSRDSMGHPCSLHGSDSAAKEKVNGPYPSLICAQPDQVFDRRTEVRCTEYTRHSG